MAIVTNKGLKKKKKQPLKGAQKHPPHPEVPMTAEPSSLSPSPTCSRGFWSHSNRKSFQEFQPSTWTTRRPTDRGLHTTSPMFTL